MIEPKICFIHNINLMANYFERKDWVLINFFVRQFDQRYRPR